MPPLHPTQAAFLAHGGYQCGYCTPGQIMSAVGMLNEHKAGWPSYVSEDRSRPSSTLNGAEIREPMSGNLCRCSAYPNIVAAVSDAAGETGVSDAALRPGQLITAVLLPPPPPGVQVYRKVRDRASYAFALVSVAAIVEVVGGKIRHAKLAFGGIAPQPWRVEAAEHALQDTTPTPAGFDRAADLVLAGGRGYGHNDFKLPLARRTLAAVLARTSGV